MEYASTHGLLVSHGRTAPNNCCAVLPATKALELSLCVACSSHGCRASWCCLSCWVCSRMRTWWRRSSASCCRHMAAPTTAIHPRYRWENPLWYPVDSVLLLLVRQQQLADLPFIISISIATQHHGALHGTDGALNWLGRMAADGVPRHPVHH